MTTQPIENIFPNSPEPVRQWSDFAYEKLKPELSKIGPEDLDRIQTLCALTVSPEKELNESLRVLKRDLRERAINDMSPLAARVFAEALAIGAGVNDTTYFCLTGLNRAVLETRPDIVIENHEL